MEEAPWYTPSQDESFDRKVLRTIVTVVLTLLTIYLIYLLQTPLTWLVLAAFVAIAASGPVNKFSRHMRRGLAIAITYVLMLLIPIGLAALLLPPLVTSAVGFVDDLPTYINDFENTLQKDPRFEKLEQNFDLKQQLQTLQESLAGKIGTAAGLLSDIGAALVNSIFAGFTVFVLSIFMVARGRLWLNAWVRTRPEEEAEVMSRAFERIGGAVGGYIGGALLQATLAGIAAFTMLSILGVPYALALACFVALLDLIPMVGSTIAGIGVGVVTLFADFPIDTIIWGVFVIAYQQFENYVIQPKIQSQAVNLEPFVILVAVLFGGSLFGVMGALLAIPIAATLQIIYQEYGHFRREVEKKYESEAAENSGGPEPEPA
jgi:predicted PurR-regulated permease PerM